MLFLSGGTALKGFGKAGNDTSGDLGSGGAINTARRNLGGAGEHNIFYCFAGATTASVANTETYNGSHGQKLMILNEARNHAAGAGTQTASSMLFLDILQLDQTKQQLNMGWNFGQRLTDKTQQDFRSSC